MNLTTSQLWLALLKQRCPRCSRGRIFRGVFAMHPDCPECGFHFEREPGYFLGALYLSYGMSCTVLLFFMFVAWRVFPEWDARWYVLVAGVVYVPLVPLVFRYSRVIWMYYDHWLWPQRRDGEGS